MTSKLPFGYGPALLGSYLLGIALVYSNGAYSESALLCILLAALVLTWRYFISLRGDPSGAEEVTTAVGLVWVALASMLWAAWNDQGLIIYARRPWDVGREAQTGLFLLLCSYLPGLIMRKREAPLVRAVRFALIAACVVAAGVDVIKASPAPAIDVWTIQMKGAEAFSKGLNPYVVVQTTDTAPGGSTLIIPYTYPPLQVYLSWFGWKFFGDVRYTMLFAVMIVGTLYRAIAKGGRPGFPALIEDAPALFFWLAPKQFFVLEQAWIDSVQLMFVTLGVFAYLRRRPYLAAVFFGLLLGSKQSMIFIIPMAALMLGLSAQQWVVIAVVAGATVLPSIMWDFKAFKYGVFDLANNMGPRPDGLTFSNWGARKYGWAVTATPGFLLASLVTSVSMWRLRGVAYFASSIALTYLLFFSFNKWAFANYYYFIGGLAALAAAASFHAHAIKENS